MVGARSSVVPGWNQVGEVRAWTSRTPRFSADPHFVSSPERIFQIRLDSPFLAELQSLAKEKDPEIFYVSLLQLGQRLEAENKLEAASQVYATLVTDPSPSRERVSPLAPPDGGEGRMRASFHEIRRRARERLNAMTGTGSSAHRAEFLLGRLSRETMEPTSLVGLTAASAAFRMTRLASLSRLLGSSTANFATRGFGARATASLLGFSVEATVFPLASRGAAAALGRDLDWSLHQVGREIAGSFLVLGSMKLVGWGRGPTLQQAGMFAGILLGHHLETVVGLRPNVDGATTFVDSLAMLVQFNAAGRIAHGIMGEGFRAWELGLDYQARILAETPHSITGRGRPVQPKAGQWILRPDHGIMPALAGDHMGSPLQMGEARKGSHPALRHHLFSQRHGSETPPPQTRAQAIRERYLPLFPPTGSRGEEILQTVCRIRCQLPDFHERLIQALLHAPNAGTREQLYLVIAIEDVFASDAVRTATGSFDYSLLQLLLGRALSESNGAYRNLILQRIFQGMEGEYSRDNWLQLAEQLGFGVEPHFSSEPLYTPGFWEAHSAEAGEAWANYRPEDQTVLFNFAYQHSVGKPEDTRRIIQTFSAGRRDSRYFGPDLDAALDYSREIAYGQLVLQRLYDIFATQDSPSKLVEITRTSLPISNLEQVFLQIQRGHSPESLAYEINGSSHTAYFNDVRLARKVLSVFEDMAPYLHDSSLRENNKERLVEAFDSWSAQSKPLEVEDLFKLLETNTHPVTEAFMIAWLAGKFEVEILPAAIFDERVADWGQAADCDLAIYFPKGGSGGQGVILVKDLPRLELGSEPGRIRAFGEVMARVKALAHEAEHWRHITGNFLGMERPSRPFVLTAVSREERYISEIMAYLEEFRWRARNLDLDFWEISSRLGEPLAVYLRGIADRSYFRSSNEGKALR